MAAAMMSCRQLAVDNSSSAKSRSACLVSMSLRNADANPRSGAIASRAGHGSSQSELRASPGRKSLLMHGFDDQLTPSKATLPPDSLIGSGT